MLEMRGIVKRFPGVIASDHVDFDVRPGEVHTLLGENGAGKSTLMKILYGLYQADEGELLLSGEQVEIHSPTDAISHGIGMIHQHFMLVETLTVAENVALGLKSNRGIRTDLDAGTADRPAGRRMAAVRRSTPTTRDHQGVVPRGQVADPG
jgi:simple sugar transport system ATP-binding protein